MTTELSLTSEYHPGAANIFQGQAQNFLSPYFFLTIQQPRFSVKPAPADYIYFFAWGQFIDSLFSSMQRMGFL